MKHKLETLIRLRRQLINEKRRHLVRVQEEWDRLNQELAQLRIALVAEQQPGADPETGFTYPAFVQATMDREELLVSDMEDIQAEIDRITDDLGQEYQHLKRYEIVAERAEQRTRKEKEKRDQDVLDEVALDRFRASKPGAG